MTQIDHRAVNALNAAAIEYDEENFTMASSFHDNGIDSLDVMSLFLAIEETYRIKFSEDEANAINTPHELMGALDRKLSGR